MDCVHNRLLTCLLTLDRPLICFGGNQKENLGSTLFKENKYIKHMGAKINVQVATTDSGVKVLYTPITKSLGTTQGK